LLEGLPESSKYKEAAQRTFRIVEYVGRFDIQIGDHMVTNGQLLLMPAIGPLPDDFELVEEFVDWTFDQKLMARTVRELIVANGYQDFSGVTEPVNLIQEMHQARKDAAIVDLTENIIRAGLYGKVVNDAGLS